MSNTRDRIVKGCKYMVTTGSFHWDARITRVAIKALRDLLTEEMSEVTSAPATPADAERIFNEPTI